MNEHIHWYSKIINLQQLGGPSYEFYIKTLHLRNETCMEEYMKYISKGFQCVQDTNIQNQLQN